MLHLLRPYQIQQHNSFFEYFANGNNGNPLIAAPTGCHARGQQLLMYDGTLKAVEHICMGDQLMGPDSLPRTVLRLCRGRQAMRKIVPTKGTSWIVNKDHILSLYHTPEETEQLHTFTTETVETYVNSSNWHKHTHKLWRTGVNFPSGKHLTVNPYFLGVFLGDGSYTTAQLTITSPDAEVLTYCADYWKILGDRFSYQKRYNSKTGVTTWQITAVHTSDICQRSVIAQLITNLELEGCKADSKYIPQQYKTANRSDRLDLLAGLIDTDGHLATGVYDFISKSKQLSEDVAFVARSVGLAAYVTASEKYYQTGADGTYWRVLISGDINIIPCKVQRKKSVKRVQKKNVLVTGFTVEHLDEDDYFGFELDGDHLYLLDDFTVTHNTGKSWTIAAICYSMLTNWPTTRIIMCTHVKELVAQNADKLWQAWPQAPLGIYSAGLKRKQYSQPIIFGGIASIVRNMDLFGWRDVLIVDEAQLVSPNEATMYQQLIAHFTNINPNFKVLGLSATIYRLGQGYLTDQLETGNRIFTDVVCNQTTPEWFTYFVKNKFMVPLITPGTLTVKLDVTGVKITAGEFNQNQLAKAVDKEEITTAGLKEDLALSENRRCIMVFGSGIAHCEHIAATLQAMGQTALTVHSNSTHRDEYIRAFKQNQVRFLVVYRIGTVGFDNPMVDAIWDYYPTISTTMHVQKYGRGTRPYTCGQYTKIDCLVLDHADNTRRLGPIDDPIIPRRRGSKGGTPPIKQCDVCGMLNHIRNTECMHCGNQFNIKIKITEEAASETVMSAAPAPVIERILNWYEVVRVIYNLHHKEGSPDSIKVTYICKDLASVSEWLCPEHASNYAKIRARKWWQKRCVDQQPATVNEWLAHTSRFLVPKRIQVHINKKPYPEILNYEF